MNSEYNIFIGHILFQIITTSFRQLHDDVTKCIVLPLHIPRNSAWTSALVRTWLAGATYSNRVLKAKM